MVKGKRISRRPGKNPLRKVTRSSEDVTIPKGLKVRRLHKAFLRYHDSGNWPLLREALKRMGREDLIGNGKKHLIPRWQPAGTGDKTPIEQEPRKKGGTFKTQHVRSAQLDTERKKRDTAGKPKKRKPSKPVRHKRQRKPGSPVGQGKRR